MLKHQPKTLAKTLTYIALHAPGEFGLFWDPDGTMPWKELYWALQEDPELRFVRESSIKELALLGIELPFTLDGNLLRLRAGIAPPEYAPCTERVLEKLYFAVRPRGFDRAKAAGLIPGGRSFIPLASDRGLALRIARRRDSEAILVEILAAAAQERGVSFFKAGPELYLVEAILPEFIVFPMIKQDLAEKIVQRREKQKEKPALPIPTPGSFTVQARHIMAAAVGAKPDKGAPKRQKGGWKKASRNERHKRDV